MWTTGGVLFQGTNHKSYRRMVFCSRVPGKPMSWTQSQVEGEAVRGIVKGCRGQAVSRVVFPGTTVMLSFRGNMSDVVGSLISESDGESACTGTAKAVSRKNKIDWTKIKDKDSMMPLPVRIRSCRLWVAYDRVRSVTNVSTFQGRGSSGG